MARYGVVLSGLAAGALAYQTGLFQSLSSSKTSLVEQTNNVPKKDVSKEIEIKKFAVKTAPQFDGIHYYETLITCPRL